MLLLKAYINVLFHTSQTDDSGQPMFTNQHTVIYVIKKMSQHAAFIAGFGYRLRQINV